MMTGGTPIYGNPHLQRFGPGKIMSHFEQESPHVFPPIDDYDLTCLLWDRLTWLPCQRVETLSRLILHHGCPVKSLALSVCWQVFHGCVAFAQLCSTENARLQDDIEHHNSIPSMSSGQCCDSTCLDRNVSHMGMGQHRVAPKTGEGSYMHLIVIERYMPCLKHVRCKPYV